MDAIRSPALVLPVNEMAFIAGCFTMLLHTRARTMNDI